MELRKLAALLLLGAGIGWGTPAKAEVIAATDFTARTVSGLIASNLSWTIAGVEDPGDLSVLGGAPGLFDTTNTQGHFAPDRNVGNEGPWSVDVPLVLSAASITLESVELDWQHFNNSGVFQDPSRSVDWTVSVTGSDFGLIAGSTVGALGIGGTSGIETLTFPGSLVLSSSETYVLNINATGSNTTGNNTGLDGLTINGTVGAGSGTDLAITEFSLVGDVLSVTWTSVEGASYRLTYSSDLGDWEGELDDSMIGAPGDHTTRILDLSESNVEIEEFERLFFRVEPGGEQ